MLENINWWQRKVKIQIKIQIMPYIFTTHTYTNVFILIFREVPHKNTSNSVSAWQKLVMKLRKKKNKDLTKLN